MTSLKKELQDSGIGSSGGSNKKVAACSSKTNNNNKGVEVVRLVYFYFKLIWSEGFIF